MTTTETGSLRFGELDGIRGIAAFFVFFSHVAGLLYESEIVRLAYASPLRIFWDGAAAVDLFFVLSGFVLSLPFLVNKTNVTEIGYGQFAVKRIFRLFPAFWVALVFSLVLRAEYNPASMLQLSEWAKIQWTHQITLGVILKNIFMLPGAEVNAIDPVIWSLIVELRMSLLLPLIILILNRSERFFLHALLVLATIFLGFSINALTYLPLFTVGAIAAKWLMPVRQKLLVIGKLQMLCILLFGIALYGNRGVFHIQSQYMKDLISGFGAVIVILLALSSIRFSQILSLKIFEFMGKTSYSFYLLHLPILLYVTSLLYPSTGSIFICAIVTLVVAYPLSYLVFRFIELPANACGRTISYAIKNFELYSKKI